MVDARLACRGWSAAAQSGHGLPRPPGGPAGRPGGAVIYLAVGPITGSVAAAVVPAEFARSAPLSLRRDPRELAGCFHLAAQPSRRDVEAVRPGGRAEFEKH